MNDPAPPLHLEREAKRMLGFVVIKLHEAVLVGYPAPRVETLRLRMYAPQPGDLVFEASTIHLLLGRDPELEDDRWDGQFLTYLRSEIRTWCSPEEWAEEHAGYLEDGQELPPIPKEEVYVCLNPDGTEFVWENAQLLALPSSYDFVPR